MGLLVLILPGFWLERRKLLPVALVALIVVVALAFWPQSEPIKVADCRGCSLITEDDSAYNYIQIVERGSDANKMIGLVLNEGQAIHSIYYPKFEQTNNASDLLTNGPWDFYNIAPYFYPNRSMESVNSMAMVGSAAGSVPKQFLAIYGKDSVIDGIEIDPRIVELGREYFAMHDVQYYQARGETPQFPNFNTYVADGRIFFAGNDNKYDIIGMDAYKQPYIPFHLTTREFFETVRDHLAPNGVAVVNAGKPNTAAGGDYRLVNVLASTMSSVFAHVYMIDVPNNFNTMLIGIPGDVGDGVANFEANLATIQDPTLRYVMEQALASNSSKKPIRRWDGVGENRVFTDDLAPVESVIDRIILGQVDEGQ